jgi:hypothetical protein
MFVNCAILCEASGHQVREKFVFRTALVLGYGRKCNLERFADLIGTGAEFGTQAYQTQQALPDRHARDYIRTKVLGQGRYYSGLCNKSDNEERSGSQVRGKKKNELKEF